MMLMTMMAVRTISQEKVSVCLLGKFNMRAEHIVLHTRTYINLRSCLTLVPDRYLENFTPPRFTISMTAEPVAREKNFECQGQNTYSSSI